MKKTGLLILLVVLTLCMVAFAACGKTVDPKQNDDPAEQVHTHTFGELIAEVAATCEKDGVKAHKHCSGCDKDFDADGKELTDLVIPKLGHKLEEVAEAPATCAAEGTKAHQKCATCGKLFDAEGKEVTAESLKIEKLTEHTIVEKAEEPQTCAKEGVKAHKECSVCGKLFDLNGNETTAEALAIAKNAHDNDKKVEKVPASYGVDGMEEHYECTSCGAYFDKDKKEVTKESLVIPALKASEGLEFKSNGDGTCVVTGIGECTDTDIVIPAASSDGDKVIGISKRAFSRCATIESVTIPESVEEIDDLIFEDCTALKKLVVASGNKTYFSQGNCIILKETKTLVAGCLGSVIPSDGSVTTVGDYAFWGCGALESIVIPGCIKEIGEDAFYGCDHLKKVSFVGTQMDQWEAVTKPANWKLDVELVASQELDFTIFTDENDENKEKYAVKAGDCEDTILVIPATYQPSSDKKALPVTQIGKDAFKNYSGITHVTIPASIKKIGDSAFEGCKNITVILFLGTAAEWDAIDMGTDWAKNVTGDVLIIVGENDPTETEHGNIKYYKSYNPLNPLGGSSYFSDAAGKNPIALESTVIHNLILRTQQDVICGVHDGYSVDHYHCTCTNCGKNFEDANGVTPSAVVVTPAPEQHTDEDHNDKCDVCGATMPQ